MSEDPKNENESAHDSLATGDDEIQPVEKQSPETPENTPEATAGSEPVAEEVAQPEVKAEKPAQPEAKAKKPAQPEVKAEKSAQPEVKAEKPAQPEAKAEKSAQPEVKAEKPAQPEAKAEKPVKAVAKSEEKSDEEPSIVATKKGKPAAGGKKEDKPASADEESRPKELTAKDLLKEDLGEIKVRRSKGSKNVHSGVVSILATFNNTKVTFADKSGNVISWSSAGKCGFRGSRKSTAYAAQVLTQDAGRKAMGHGLKEVDVRVKGPGMGRDSAIRALQSLGLNILSITDVTPVPHNGCRPPKRRRV